MTQAAIGGGIGFAMGALSGAMMAPNQPPTTPATEATKDGQAIQAATEAYGDAILKGGNIETLREMAKVITENGGIVPLGTGEVAAKSFAILGSVGIEENRVRSQQSTKSFVES